VTHPRSLESFHFQRRECLSPAPGPSTQVSFDVPRQTLYETFTSPPSKAPFLSRYSGGVTSFFRPSSAFETVLSIIHWLLSTSLPIAEGCPSLSRSFLNCSSLYSPQFFFSHVVLCFVSHPSLSFPTPMKPRQSLFPARSGTEVYLKRLKNSVPPLSMWPSPLASPVLSFLSSWARDPSAPTKNCKIVIQFPATSPSKTSRHSCQ